MELHMAVASTRERNFDRFGSDLYNVLPAHHGIGHALRQLRTSARNARDSDYERYANALIRCASETAYEIECADMAAATRVGPSQKSRCDTVCETCGVGFGPDCTCGRGQ